MNRSPWRLEEVDGSSWRLEEVDSGDEQYAVESRFAVRHTPPDEQDPHFDRSAPTQVRFVCFAIHHTLPDQLDPRFDRRRSVSSVLQYALPLPINRTPVSTVAGPFPPFCGTPHPSRSTGPRSERVRSNTRPFPPFCDTPGLVYTACSVQAGWLPRVLLPPNEHDAFSCLAMNTMHSFASP